MIGLTEIKAAQKQIADFNKQLALNIARIERARAIAQDPKAAVIAEVVKRARGKLQDVQG